MHSYVCCDACQCQRPWHFTWFYQVLNKSLQLSEINNIMYALCDPIWQLTPRSSEMVFREALYTALTQLLTFHEFTSRTPTTRRATDISWRLSRETTDRQLALLIENNVRIRIRLPYSQLHSGHVCQYQEITGEMCRRVEFLLLASFLPAKPTGELCRQRQPDAVVPTPLSWSCDTCQFSLARRNKQVRKVLWTRK